MVDHNKIHTTALFVKWWTVDWCDVLLICICPCLRSRKKRRKGNISVNIHLHRNPKGLLVWRLLFSIWKEKRVHILFTVLDLENIACPNFQWPFLDFWPFRGILGKTSKASNFRMVGTLMSFDVSKYSSQHVLGETDNIGFQWLFTEKSPVGRYSPL